MVTSPGGRRLLLAVCLAVVLAAVPRAWVRLSTTPSAFAAPGGRVYTVANLERAFTRDPEGWLGRMVLVRGVLIGCPHLICLGHEPNTSPPLLIDPDDATGALPVIWAGPDPVAAFLRRVPVLGMVVPPPQVPHWDVVAAYRARLSAQPAGSRAVLPCYAAMVLDTAPDILGEG